MPFVLKILKAFVEGRSDLDIGNLDEREIDYLLRIGLGSVLAYVSEESHGNDLVAGSAKVAAVLNGNQLDFLRQLMGQASPKYPIIVLKGCAMALLYYPRPSTRVMGDIDVLVTPEQQQELEQFCLTHGFSKESIYPEEFYQGFHHSMPLFNPQTRVWVELHTHLFNREEVVSAEPVFQLSNVQSQTEVCEFDGLQYLSLSKELLLVYTCTHWALECNWQKSAVRLLDLLLITKAKDKPIDWNKVITLVGESPVSASCLYVVLGFFNQYDLVSLPDNVLPDLKANSNSLNNPITALLGRFIRRYSLEGKAFGRIGSEANIGIIWSTLLFNNNNSWFRLFILVPKNIVFPPMSQNKYSIAFQLNRIKHVLLGEKE